MSATVDIKTLHNTAYPGISPLRPELSTKGKNAVITGGGRGIGRSISESYARSGISNLAILGRTDKSLLETKAAIEAINPGTTVWTYVVDVLDAKATRSALESFSASVNGKIDILVANAGRINAIESIAESDPDDWWSCFDISTRGNYNLLRAFHPLAAPKATVVHVSTNAFYLPYGPGASSYRASRMAAYKMFEFYAYENPDLTVIQFNPGLIKTELTSVLAEYITMYGLEYQDPVLPGDFAVWAASDEAKFLNKRLVWAAWDVDELKSLKERLAADATIFTMGLI